METKETIKEVPKEYIFQMLQNAGEYREEQEKIFLAHLPEDSRREYLQIKEGERLPDLSSDVIAKKIFSPMEHPERLEFLLQRIAQDESIKIDREAMNEGYIQSSISKKVIFDITAWLVDQRLVGTEFQRIAQDFIMSRAEIYVSDLLLVQYSTQKGKPKSSVNYETVSGVLQIILMKNSPKNFDQPAVGDRYIHRFSTQVADSGLVYQKPLKETIFVQLDKCFEQFLEGKDGENDPEIQILLSALYNVNEPKILEHTKDNDMLKDIVAEVRRISEDKEVQAMLLSEKYAEADLNAVKSYERREGVQEGKIEVYKNMLTLGYSKEEAMVAAKIPKEVADAI